MTIKHTTDFDICLLSDTVVIESIKTDCYIILDKETYYKTCCKYSAVYEKYVPVNDRIDKEVYKWKN